LKLRKLGWAGHVVWKRDKEYVQNIGKKYFYEVVPWRKEDLRIILQWILGRMGSGWYC
jgi:hypothetical protein